MLARLALTALLTAAMVAPAAAPADPSDADCSVDAAKRYRSKPALRRGLPVTVTCDGPATFFVAVHFLGHGEDYIDPSHSGVEGFSATVDLADAGSKTVRVKLERYAKRAARRTLEDRPRFRIFFDMGIEREDGEFHNIPKPAAQPYSKIVR